MFGETHISIIMKPHYEGLKYNIENIQDNFPFTCIDLCVQPLCKKVYVNVHMTTFAIVEFAYPFDSDHVFKPTLSLFSEPYCGNKRRKQCRKHYIYVRYRVEVVGVDDEHAKHRTLTAESGVCFLSPACGYI